MSTQCISLRCFDPSQAPEGYIFGQYNGREVEQKCFPEWKNPLRRNGSSFEIVVDARAGGKRVLSHYDETDLALTTGDPLWRDYGVRARIRQMLHTSVSAMDKESMRMVNGPATVVGRTGIMFRYQNIRNYYLYCIEGLDRLVLYRREHDNYIPLAWKVQGWDRSRYYELEIRGEGDTITCFLDGRKEFVVNDGVFRTGKTGIRTDTMSRFELVEVFSSKEWQAVNANIRKDYDEEVAKLREGYPKPVLAKEVTLPVRGDDFTCKFARLLGNGEKQALILQAGVLSAVNLDGALLWQFGSPEAPNGQVEKFKCADIDGDGAEEVVCLAGAKICILCGREGSVLSEGTLPAKIYTFYICNLRGRPFASDICLTDGGSQVWAFDESFSLLWHRAVPFGHEQGFYDLDGDGREEAMIGYHLLDGEGKVIWEVEGSEYFLGGNHVDYETGGDLDGNPDNGCEITMTCSGLGYMLVDARTGAIRRQHLIGHAQGLSVGNYRPDLPGLETWVGNRWGSYGLLTLFDGSGNMLFSFEPDNVSQGGLPANWKGDGEELLLMSSTLEARGMYDARGRKVVEFPEETRDLAFLAVDDVLGDPRDELIFGGDRALFIYTQDTPFAGERIYAPIRLGRLERPAISYPGWKENRR